MQILQCIFIVTSVSAMLIHRPWDSRDWCERIVEPYWPFAYQKDTSQTLEWKGRVAWNQQDMRHSCDTRGGQSKCHICEDIQCGDSVCSYQLQGIPWTLLAKNIPTVSDVPWSVGGSHRYDYKTGTHICMMISGGDCLVHDATDYSDCKTRCWGQNSGTIFTRSHVGNFDASTLIRADADASDVWEYPKTRDGENNSPQGSVGTWAGTGESGYLDGPAAVAQFANPQDVAVDVDRNIYIADTDNHRIRMISAATQEVTTIAGDGVEGFIDGPIATARFSYPSGIAVFRRVSNGNLVIFIADTGNHRIRRIENGAVSCYAGRCGQGTETETISQSEATPQPGFADGSPAVSRFHSPRGLDVTDSGVLLIADTGNKLIRRIGTDGMTSVLAGSIEEADTTPGCPPPCYRGVAGTRDGNLTYAQFLDPVDVTLGPDDTAYVSDDNRIRRLAFGADATIIQGVESQNRVATIAGGVIPGLIDGTGDEARLNRPSGLAVTQDGRVYTASPVSCKVRRITAANDVVETISCDTRADELVKPSGCTSYNMPVDALNQQTTSLKHNVFYNFLFRDVHDAVLGVESIGRKLENCVSTPPLDILVQGSLSVYMRDGSGDRLTDINEDTGYGTAIKVVCPAGCAATSGGKVFGTSVFSDTSVVCAAAIHSGIIDDTGGMIQIVLERSTNFEDPAISTGSTQNGIVSETIPSMKESSRMFSLLAYPLSTVEVHTIAGLPTASLGGACGFQDATPAQEAKFNFPRGIAIHKPSSLTNTEYLYIADSGNHRIRYMTAVCSQICENGGTCVAPDVCVCPNGWTGYDCATPVCTDACTDRTVCVGPDTCDCIPGYTGANCDVPTCSQSCEHGGSCSAPDTCSCTSGWFDTNCTTPVCEQTCGNGGNCTLPNTCSCAAEWQGHDCRVPVCDQTCLNGAHCIAPNTCQCTAGWSGHDCSIPVCSQGFFEPDPSTYMYATSRPWSWDLYVPCQVEEWCISTNEFDCQQKKRTMTQIDIDWGSVYRSQTGRKTQPENCAMMELRRDAITYFQYQDESNQTSSYYRYSPLVGYGSDASGWPWQGILTEKMGYMPPWTFEIDRQVAMVEKRSVVQGVYRCANEGNCSSPNVCHCAPGWSGFDCRTPICSQGYYSSDQNTFIGVEPPAAAHARHPITNPTFQQTIEVLTASSLSRSANSIPQGTRYLGPTGAAQGGYACSIRSITEYEKPLTIGADGSPAFYFNHPNYYSRYMDTQVMNDGRTYTHWKDMYWPPLYEHTNYILDETDKGWERGGIFRLKSNVEWQKGKCLLEFKRVCRDSPSKAYDLETDTTGFMVTDPDVGFRPRIDYADPSVSAIGRWTVEGGECVDHVIRGCFNNGTCVAPDTCECAPGWSGYDCTSPICSQTCFNNGNCTLPDTCTCEIGWMGHDCSIPLCAQECRNGGKCIAPDTCECYREPSKWRDGREGARPLYRKPNGDPQDTGYTGYDCSTPICTQAEKFILNVPRNSPDFVSLRGHGKTGQVPCATERCPFYDEEVTGNDGYSFQAGCRVGNLVPEASSSLSEEKQVENLQSGLDHTNVNRSSATYLCGRMTWEQGDYLKGRHTRVNYEKFVKLDQETWMKEPGEPGEGIYACFNKGSCIAPDTCTCGDGFEGIDCNTPTCRFRNTEGEIVGCQHHAVCVEKDQCKCIQTNSILHSEFSDAPKGVTGWAGVDCSIAMCVQGYFDPLCNDSTAGTEGCYRCANGGKCVAPDLCECAEGWTGYNCMTPVCHVDATDEIREQLFTLDEAKVHAFELDPCGTNGGRWGKEVINGVEMGQGNCTLPNLCTCLCRVRHDYHACMATGEFCDRPWIDPLDRDLPSGYVFGTKSCYDGFQGIEDEQGRFMSCHLQIYVPSFFEEYSVSFVTILSTGCFFAMVIWHYIRRRRKRKFLLEKAYRLKKMEEQEEAELERLNPKKR